MKIGDKVVCVDDEPGSCHCYYCTASKALELRLGCIYVIEGFEIQEGCLGLVLIGTRPIGHKRIMSFLASRFRLLDHLKEANRNKQSEGVKI